MNNFIVREDVRVFYYFIIIIGIVRKMSYKIMFIFVFGILSLLSQANITNNYYYKTTKLLVKNNIINNSKTNGSVNISNRYLLAQYENQTKNYDYKKGFDVISKYENQTKYGKQPQNHKEAYDRGVDMVSKGNSKGWIYIIIGSIGYAVKLFCKHKK